MSAAPLLETAIFISPDQYVRMGEYSELPLHVDIVDQFTASQKQAERLAGRIAASLFRNTFEITGFDHTDRASRRVQRLGGSVLHNVRQEIVEIMDRMNIVHGNVPVPDGSDETWYEGTWYVPNHRTEITAAHLAQKTPDECSWQILRTYNLHVPANDFRSDPLYLESLHSPVKARRSA